jgi:hypothetical protein
VASAPPGRCRAGQEAHVCECYQVVKNESDRLLPEVIVP